MSPQTSDTEKYAGFEQGPIRPPSEAESLLIRVSRNCPWNQCSFCGFYKGKKFSMRPVDHILRDIDTVYDYVQKLLRFTNEDGHIQFGRFHAFEKEPSHDSQALHAAVAV